MTPTEKHDSDANWPSRLYLTFAEDPQPVVDFLAWLMEQYTLPAAPRILDLGAGPGASFRCYAGQPWSVVAMEPDDDFFTHAADIAAQIDNVQVEQGGFGDLVAEQVYDLAISVNGGFAYLLEADAQQDALRRLYAALKPGGLLLLDIPNLLWFLRHEPDEKQQTRRLGNLTVDFWRRCHFDYHDARFVQTNEYIVRDPSGERLVVRRTHPHVIWTYPALVEQLRVCGFSQWQTYDGYTARESARLTGPRIIVTARRPRS